MLKSSAHSSSRSSSSQYYSLIHSLRLMSCVAAAFSAVMIMGIAGVQVAQAESCEVACSNGGEPGVRTVLNEDGSSTSCCCLAAVEDVTETLVSQPAEICEAPAPQ